MDFLEALNPRQKEAVTHGDGPLLVIAGAGSGKTRVLAYRVAYLIRAGKARPDQILAVTFTNKAAQEMQDRVAQLIGGIAKGVWASTFHSACVRILRVHAEAIGYSGNFQIFDTADQLVVAKEALQELNLDPKHFEPKAILASISNAKNELIGPSDFDAMAADYWQRQVSRVYRLYQEKLAWANGFDFDDLIMQTVHLFRTHPNVLQSYQERFRYVLVDEYQDTNHAQYVLVSLLVAQHRNLCVVGDDDQSIYGFRGADIRNILDFEQDFPNTKVIRLEQNYRSTQNILDAANNVIANNIGRKGKNLFTENGPGEKLRFCQAYDERQEAAFAANTIAKEVEWGQRQYQDFTILYRAHAQSRSFEEEFVRQGIPYRIVAGLRFYERKEIKDLLAYLRLLANPMDNYSFKRVINVPKRGIGPGTIAKLEDFAQSQSLSLLQAVDRIGEAAALSERYKRMLAAFGELYHKWRRDLAAEPVSEIVSTILEDTGYRQMLSAERTIEAEARLENLSEFMSVARQFDQDEGNNGLEEFLEQIALMSEVDNYDQEANAVSLMTLHAAKGLEFPVVFLVGMEDGVFPSARSIWEPGQLEEERRLAYVGLTRAKEQVYLTCAYRRMLFGTTSENPVSMFVKEIPESVLERADDHPPRLAQAETHGFVPEGREVYQVGDWIYHQHFGEGIIVEVRNDVIKVNFADNKTKLLVAGMAPIEKM
ncbi:MAG: DNA helicase PcrA [Firmicutes bacterium]|jgi:DNA helicase-2/ATP-dependent DNA helicase PcrA|nr:DNA helicase PcrA [Bacillota bacterium]NLL89284.1 DNA helicase PcrA [Bacillota bacterium]